MAHPQNQTIHLADYKPFSHDIENVDLTFQLSPNATVVKAVLTIVPKQGTREDLVLDGEDLDLKSIAIDGAALTSDAFTISDTALTILANKLPSDRFVLETLVEIDPSANTELEGLYMSNGMYCTQCEAEGFHKITYYPDRPDVMSIFTVRIEGELPVLLSNGNPTAAGPGWAEWHDPWPKPCYLFALVAGDLVAHSDSFKTQSGRSVDLNIYVRPGDEGKCAYAMDSLIRSMRWDEQAYGREYDLDVFNIVAVDDFNMGAMENKGLNIFNSKYVLASPETATDVDYEFIEGIIAHEYFHNWTGNRITCRDWFQLSLKEGLTVFRDQQFSGDMRSHAVKRIDDVLQLRARQFREDSGPLSHAVRPESFVEINNFYTATVYEKGAEVIGMLKTLVGDDAYKQALDTYFDRHDGQAATVEDWLSVFQDTTGRDLDQFKRWYQQAGTPKLSVSEEYADGRYSLTFQQNTPATPGQTDKLPLTIPIAVGLLNDNGDEVVPTTILEMTEAQQTFHFHGLASRPVASVLRGFSAPVILSMPRSREDQAFLLSHDTDPFNKWEAGRALAKDVLVDMIVNGAKPDPLLFDGLSRVLSNDTLDPAFRALALALPSEDDLAQTLFDAGVTPDPTQIHKHREKLLDAAAAALEPQLPQTMADVVVPGPYTPDALAAGKRALRGAALKLLTRLDGGAAALNQFNAADNMTEQAGALTCLIPTPHGPDAIARFYDQWHTDRLVMDKWFMMQVAYAPWEKALSVAKRLEDHDDFNWKNPNRLRSLLNGLTGANPAAFHDPSGAAYEWLADWILRVDQINPQVAARTSGTFETWRRYDVDRQQLIRAQLDRIAAKPDLSRNTNEMVNRILES